MPVNDCIDFVIIGAQKSGTTSLHEVMKMHPKITMPASKEVPIFNRTDLSPDEIAAKAASLFQGSPAGSLKGKASPQYLPSKTALENLYAINPKMKIIAILRDPVERSYSHFRMVKRRAGEEGDFDHEIFSLLEQDRLIQARATEHENKEDESAYIVAWSEYGRMLEPYFEKFGRENMLILYTRDLEQDGEAVYARIFDFLGIDRSWTAPEMTAVFHKGGDKPIVNVKKLKKIPVFGWLLKTTYNLLPGHLRYLISTRNIRAISKSARDLHPSTSALLDRHFAEDQSKIDRLVAGS